MKDHFLQIIVLVLGCFCSVYAQSNSWNNLTPLRATRSNVEKLLGQPKDNKYGYFDYESADGLIRVKYSTRLCQEGWNVPLDSVLSISIAPAAKIGKNSTELKLDANRFALLANDTADGNWVDSQEGLIYHFKLLDRELTAITYIPKKSDYELRCDGFPPYSPESMYSPLIEQAFDQRLNEIYARTDGFLFNLFNAGNTEYKGYVVVYFDRKIPLREYRERLKKVRQHIFTLRKIPSERVTIIEGGLKENSMLAFYVVKRDDPAPALEPDFPSPQFMKKKK